jgi:hypothetical protein
VFAADPASTGGSGSDYSLKGLNRASEDAVHIVYSFHHVRALGSTGGTRPPSLPDDFAACPEGATANEIAASDGSFARFCVAQAGSAAVDHGPYRKWYASGTLGVKGEMNMGTRVGKWQTWDESGQLVAELDY